MGCGVWYQQLSEVDRALSSLRTGGISELSDVYQTIYKTRGELMARIGYKFPRSITQLLRIAGLSPGIIALFHDIESGWLTEARIKPGATPVYHYVSDEIALRLIKHEIDHELEDQLMTPDSSLDVSEL